MPLSDHEQKMLEQMEQALAAEDPKFASQMKGSALSSPRGRRLLLGGVGVLLGLALVVLGVSTTMWVGALGFAVMVLATLFALTPPRRPGLGVVTPEGTVRAPKQPRRGGFMGRMDERWDRRQGGI